MAVAKTATLAQSGRQAGSATSWSFTTSPPLGRLTGHYSLVRPHGLRAAPPKSPRVLRASELDYKSHGPGAHKRGLHNLLSPSPLLFLGCAALHPQQQQPPTPAPLPRGAAPGRPWRRKSQLFF